VKVLKVDYKAFSTTFNDQSKDVGPSGSKWIGSKQVTL
jgi:hypothetical protein